MKSKADSAVSEQQFIGYLHARKMRCTGERLRILHTALSMPEGFTPAALAARLEEGGYHVSTTTVYAGIRTMCEASVLRRAMDPDGKVLFFPTSTAQPRVTLKCTICGKVKATGIPELTRLIVRRRYWGFSATSFDLRVDGLCSRCRKALESGTQTAKSARTSPAKSSQNITSRNGKMKSK